MKEEYLAAWASLDWLSHTRYINIKKLFKNLEEAWVYISEKELLQIGEKKEDIEKFFALKKTIIPLQEYEKIQKNKSKLLFLDNEKYPKKLKEISSIPIFLYYKGSDFFDDLCFSIVGTRKITSYGKQASLSIVPELSKYFTIVSGLALGVDSLVHELCIKEKGKTLAIIGNGLDIYYPHKNRYLTDKIIMNNGSVISEFPFGTMPNNFNFPRRNRIISGLSIGTLIIEGQIGSGSLITAKFALNQNREVFAIPGSIFSKESSGTNQLIKKNSAKLVTNPNDIFEELFLSHPLLSNKERVNIHFDTNEEKIIYNNLTYDGKDINQLAEDINLPISKINSILTILELKQYVYNLGSGIWVKK